MPQRKLSEVRTTEFGLLGNLISLDVRFVIWVQVLLLLPEQPWTSHMMLNKALPNC